MTREEIMQLNTDYLNDCESEHEMNELFYFVLELLKHEQEPNCPYYVIDEDGHGLCKNHRLEQEPSGDAISRQAVLDIVNNPLNIRLDEIIKKLPSVNPQEQTDTWSIKEVADALARHGLIVEQEPCEDVISRQAVINAIDKWVKNRHILMTLPPNEVTPLFESVHELPSVNPQEPKTGHWMNRGKQGEVLPFYMRYECSICGETADKSNYCPNCGAKMLELQESEDEE